MMQRLISWFREYVYPRETAPDASLRETGVRVRPPSERPAGAQQRAVREPPAPDLRLDTDLGGRIEDGGPGKNVLVRNKYVREDTGTHEALKIIDSSLLEEDEADAGFDPYNTGRFDRSQSWNSSRFRK